MPAPFLESALNLDLSPRVGVSTAIVGSPAAAAETIVASASLPADLQYASGVLLVAFVAYTVGTNGVSANLRVRQTDINGTVKAATGLVTQVAANLVELVAVGFDTAPAAGQIYKATLIVTSGSAASTVSNVALLALAV